MKYKCRTEINSPIKKVVNLWSDENRFEKWQDGFLSIEHIEGEANSVGAKSKILSQQGKRKMELIETILSTDLPNEKKALYVHTHMTNTQTTKFESISEGRTLYISEVEYTKFNGFIPNLMAKFFPGVFKKQSQKWMNLFKMFVENQ